MKYLNRIATFFCSAALGMLAMTSCEGGDLYGVDSPDWIQDKVDSILANKPSGDVDLPEGTEDVYTIGKTDFTSGWWADFSKYYVIPANAKWDAVFTLNINPAATNTYKNFALILTNDVDRGGDGYIEYGAIRYDHQPSGNSEWGDHINRDAVTSTLTFGTDTDPGVDKLGGRVILSIDRAHGGLNVSMNNGSVVKTYTHPGALPNLNNDPANENIRAFIVVEGSYISFMQSNLEPIGGFTSAEDKQPLSMELSGVPDEILVGTTMKDLQESISATVNFEQSVSKQVNGTELVVSVIDGDLETVGEKTLAIIYNKTFKGVNCDKPIAAVAKVKVVNELSAYTQKYFCPANLVIGAEDNSAGFHAASTESVKIESRETLVTSFTNYSDCAANWNNFLVFLTKGNGTEYCFVRADNWGMGAGYDGICTPSTTINWESMPAVMDGAKVTAYVTNNGNGTCDVKADIIGNDGVAFVQNYTGIKVDSDDLYCHFSVEKSHLVFENTIGATDNSTSFNGAQGPKIQVPAHTVSMVSFTNYSDCAANWNNFLVFLKKADGTEYGFVRADNWGMGAGYDGNCTPSTTIDWSVMPGVMDGAHVDLAVTNNGNGTCDVKAEILGNNGVQYTQTYTGIKVDSDDLYYNLSVEKSHLVLDASNAAKAKKFFIQHNGKNAVIR